jgi:hypothetical protein
VGRKAEQAKIAPLVERQEVCAGGRAKMAAFSITFIISAVEFRFIVYAKCC